MESPWVTAIVLNWNRKEMMGRCLDSLLKQTYVNLKMMVVDNASQDGSAEFVREYYPEAELICNDKNLGFTGGNNVGIRNTRTPLIALINNDTTLHPRCIEEMVGSIGKEEKVGCVATKIVLESTPDKIDAAGILVCEDGLAIGRGRMESAALYDDETEVFFASDCVCLYRKEMLDDIGLYDEDFFAYAEETDLGWRARLRGWKTIYNPRALVTHRHSASTGDYQPYKVFLVERNRWWVAFKNLPLRYVITGFWYTLRRYFFQAWGALSGQGAAGAFVKETSKWGLIKVLLSSNTSALLGLPKMLKKRREIQKNRTISTKDVKALFKLYGMSPRKIALKS